MLRSYNLIYIWTRGPGPGPCPGYYSAAWAKNDPAANNFVLWHCTLQSAVSHKFVTAEKMWLFQKTFAIGKKAQNAVSVPLA